MHRFRKKSDAKRPQLPENIITNNPSLQQLPNQPANLQDSLPALPPASDFRTSLILPSLSRRFTLLRNSNGDPVSLDDMRTKFAEQRARGAENQISEEEEDVIVQALSEIRAVNAAGSMVSISGTPSNTAIAFSPGPDGTFSGQQDEPGHLSIGGETDYSSSIRSGTAPSFASSPSSGTVYPRSSPTTSRTSSAYRYSSKRNSNNLFGSNRFHDTSYIRSVGKASVTSSRSTTSLTGSDSHGGSVRSIRSREGDGGPGRAITPDTESNGEPVNTPDAPPSNRAYPVAPLSALPPRMAKEFTLQQAGRTTLALEQVIRGIEEEAEETIMVPRTSSIRAGTLNSRTQSPKLPESPAAGTPIPWMTEEARVDDRDEDDPPQSAAVHSSASPVPPPPSPGMYPRPGTTSPTPRLPGYIPGMTRPLTPRDIDSDRDDGATGYSTTPRARSPAQTYQLPYSNHNHSLSFSSSRHHHQSSVSSEGQSILPPSILRPSRASPQVPPLRTTSPGLGNRSRGNSISNPQTPSPVASPVPEERFKSDLLSRRPLSPLIGSIGTNGYNSSRPGTPSNNGIWPPTSPLAQVHSASTPPRDTGSPRPDLVAQNANGNVKADLKQGGDTIRTNTNGVSPSLSSWSYSRAQNRTGTHAGNHVTPYSAIDMSQTLSLDSPPRSAAGEKIAARPPTPIGPHGRSQPHGESPNGHDSILLNRSVSKRSQKRIHSPISPPPIQPQSQTQVSLSPHTPSSSSNSSSNVNLNILSAATSPMFVPMLNTSVSSLLSIGSSYHSWAEENTKKSAWDQLVEYDSQRTAWQDILDSNAANETDECSEIEASGGPEQVLRSLTGLTKDDLAAMQQRLVTDAQARKGFDPPRSPLRRRRMSTSRQSYSAAAQSGRESGANSPAPPTRQPTPVTDNGRVPSLPESSSRTDLKVTVEPVANNNIQSQSTIPLSISNVASTPLSTPAVSDSSVEPQSTTDDDSSSRLPSISSSGRESHDEETSARRYKALADAISISQQPSSETHDQSEGVSPTSEPAQPQSHEEDSGEATEVPLSRSWRHPPVPVPTSNSVELVRDVTRKVAEATAALKSHSQVKINEPDNTIRRRPTKRIDFQHISSPQLVSSSTSVNAIPITHNLSPQVSPSPTDSRSSSTFSQRFKKLRGSLRTKPAARGGAEITPFILPSPANSPLLTQGTSSTLHRQTSPATPSQTLVFSHGGTPPASATEHGRFKVPVPSPPASAAPGLKSFISRFRKPKKDSGKETVTSSSEFSGHHSADSTSPSMSPPLTAKPTRFFDRRSEDRRRSEDHRRSEDNRRSEDQSYAHLNRARSPTPDPATVDQLFQAASQLGVDRQALDELLARSTSISSRNPARTQASSSAFAASRSNSTTGRPSVSRPRDVHSLDRARTPESSYKPTPRPNASVNRHPEGDVVRRTILYANDNQSVPDLSGLARKDIPSGRPQHSASTSSVQSIGSPAREPSTVPRLPASLGRTHSSKPSDSSSFYDVYSPEKNFSASQLPGAKGASSPGNAGTPEDNGHTPTVEVLEYSNGEVVWSVVDHLRAEDEEDSESLSRRSLASSRGNDVNEDLEVRFKEHRRWDSKGSNLSQGSQNHANNGNGNHHNSRRRAGTNTPRPETKLYKINASTIGHLIENISKNKDSGTFNFQRTATTAPSASASFHSGISTPGGQVERDLEELLRSINNPNS